ncbi:restriction endonuclease subunit S [Nostoc sp.]|uniref:restriction endonuclease subunit S n=1 Tax=Nostoc sp. TaxID=1180 RepID=UPI002FF45892
MAVWSIVNYLELSLDLRLDSEYYQPEYLFQEKKISNLEPRYLQNLAMISDGNHLTISEEFTDEGGVRYLRGQDLVNFFISDSNPVYIPYKAYEALNRSHMYEGDVLLSVIGTVGNVALVTNKHEHLTGSCKVAIIRPHSINPYFLAAYLASNIGKSQIYRRVRGAVQQGLILPDLKYFPVPKVDNQQAKEVEALIKDAHQCQKDSESLYAEAEALLLHELGLDNLDLSTQKSYVANFSETVESDRLDAEYYNPKYTVLINYLHKIPHSKLGYLVSFSNGATPSGAKYLDEGIPFIRIQNVTKNRLDFDDVVYIDEKIHNGILKRSQLQPGDVLITITGRIGTAAVIPDSLLFANMNQHSVRLRIHNAQINPYYLSVFLNSKAGLLQTDREAYGATRDALPYYCLEKIIIPIASLDLQKQVEVKIREAEKTLQEAKTLLERAKHQVEQIILGG